MIRCKRYRMITPYSDVDAVLAAFKERIEEILGTHFRAMYLYGSLALGDFDSKTSDIDFLIVTGSLIADDLFTRLHEMHREFAESDSPWSGKIEAAYVPVNALNDTAPTAVKYPQIEKGTALFKASLEPGWAIQRYTLREHGIVIAGPGPRTLMYPVDPDDMRRAIATITRTWVDQAHHDPTWLDWLRDHDALAFVVLTLCRSLYTLEMGTVASKLHAARWTVQTLGQRWAPLITYALINQGSSTELPPYAIDDTLALLQHVFEQSQH
jgi:hypothetical protein